MTDSPIAVRLSQIAAAMRSEERGVIDQYAIKIETIVRELEQPAAGTSAYELVAAAEQNHVETTETLIHMVAATALMRLIGDDTLAEMAETGSASVSFSPQDMDRMHRDYEMSALRDGLITTVKITRRGDESAPPAPPGEAHLEALPESLMTQDEDETPFEPQAEEHVYDRPLWAARINGKLYPKSDRESAGRACRISRAEDICQVENRFCYHNDCPAERCNHPLTTDDAK